MTKTLRTLMLTSALCVATSPLLAQDQGFALVIAPPVDSWMGFRHTINVFGETVEPAAGYVRGCAGHVMAEGAGVQLDVTDRMELLTLTVAEDNVQGMVLGTPDGLYRCVLPGADGLLAAQLPQAAPGRYRVWLAAAEASRIEARLMVADRPISAMELRGLDVAGLGAPRTGTHVFAPEGPRQVLASGATVYPDSAMDPLTPDYCAGYSRFDAADAVISVPQDVGAVSVFALSDRDLTLAVRTPEGRILCNDDSFGLNPAVTLSPAASGDYHVFVGAYSQGGQASYDLFASQGAPSWDGQAFEPGGPPRTGTFVLDAQGAAQSGQLLTGGTLTAEQPLSELPVGSCPGYSRLDAPDAIVSVEQTQEMVSLYAVSQIDLVMAVRAPDGQWLCNDDAFGLNPAVTFVPGQLGDYHVWVGAFGHGSQGAYNLYGTVGEPNWDEAEQGAAGGLNPEAEPAIGRIAFGTGTRIDPRIIFDIPPSRFEARGMGEGCVGFITPGQPDLVIDTQFGLPQLMVYMVSDSDGVLMLVGPDGTVHCNDDFEGLNPGVMVANPPPGRWAVFAGTYGGDGGLATLGVTINNPLWVMDREH